MTPPARRGKSRWPWVWAVLLALAAGLIVCHGCHPGGHGEDELGVFFLGAERPEAARQ